MDIVNFKDWVEQFSLVLRDSPSISVHTSKAYAADLGLTIAAFGEDAGLPLSVAWTPDRLSVILRQLSGRRRTPRSIARLLAAWRSFERFAAERGALTMKPAHFLPTPKVAPRVALCADRAEVERLLEAMSRCDSRAARDRAILECLCSTGLRVSELVRIRLVELGSGGRTIRIQRPGRGVRRLRLSARAVNAIGVHRVNTYGISAPTNGFLFPGQRGAHLTERTVQRAVRRRLGVVAELMKATPQLLRDSFAIWQIEAGADPHSVRRLLGLRTEQSVEYFTRGIERRQRGD